MNTSETAEDSPEKKPAGWRETYSFLMQHFTAPCLGSTNVDLVYLREIERLVEQASAVDIHMPDVADAQEVIRMWNIEAQPHVRLLVNMMQIHLSSFALSSRT